MSPFLSLLSAMGHTAVKLAESIFWAYRIKNENKPSSRYSIVVISLMDNIILGCLSAFWKHWPCEGAPPKLPLVPCAAVKLQEMMVSL